MKYKNILENNKRVLVIAFVLLSISIGCFAYSIILENKFFSSFEKQDYHTLIMNRQDEENNYVQVSMNYLPYQFAINETNSTTLKYYFIFNGSYMYIARLTDKTYDKLEKMYNEDPENFTYTLEGFIYAIPDDLKQIAIDVYNGDAENAILTDDNFANYVGKTYLDETITPSYSTANILMTIAILLFLIFLVVLIIYIISYLRLKKALKKYDRQVLENELRNAISYPKCSIYLTEHYLISSLNGLLVYEYSDLFWVYNEKRYYNGIHIGTYICAYLKNNKLYQIAYTRKDEDTLNKIIDQIKEKNKDVLVGFTDENKKLHKDYKKSLKIKD